MRTVAIGGSAGSLDVLRDVLGAIPVEASGVVVLVLHLSRHEPSLLAEVLRPYTKLAVVEAVDKMALAAGMLVVGPPDYHLLVEREGRVALSRDPAVHFSRPAIDPLFESVADAAQALAVGVLLTGANEDGAAGACAIRAAGGRLAVQDPDTALAREMPSAALARCSPDLVGSPMEIGQWLAKMLATEPR